jgi:DNA-binding winged helix-turn-helix (wHTH) protein
MSLPEKQIYRFGDVEVDASRQNHVRRGEEQHYLRPQTYQVLLYLLEQRGRDVHKEDLIRNVWKGTAVGDNSIARCVTEIRKALGDDSEDPRFIKTVPKVGYRFSRPDRGSPPERNSRHHD